MIVGLIVTVGSKVGSPQNPGADGQPSTALGHAPNVGHATATLGCGQATPSVGQFPGVRVGQFSTDWHAIETDGHGVTADGAQRMSTDCCWHRHGCVGHTIATLRQRNCRVGQSGTIRDGHQVVRVGQSS